MSEAQGLARWWIYQRERFPLAGHAPLILSFSFCAVAFSARLRADIWPMWESVAVAFVCCLLFFLQLRIADEFKDAEEDARWRPYRAVPRGLVTLRELAWVFAGAALIQAVLSYWWSPGLVWVLIGAWIYLSSMSFEFGMRRWLKAHPIIYLVSHMLIMPIVDFFATASDWVPTIGKPPMGLAYFLIASFFNGIVIEIGRKIRVTDDEEEGVETYSSLWGYKRAAIVWIIMLLCVLGFAVMAASEVNAVLAVSSILSATLIVVIAMTIAFIRNPSSKGAKRIELMAGIWTIILYLTLGVVPGLWHG